MVPPVAFICDIRRGDRANHVRAAPATTAHTESHTNAMTVKIRPRTRICPGMPPRSWLTNCGSTATKNTIVLGFVAPTTNPCHSRRPPDFGASAGWSIGVRRCRIAWMPR